MKSIALALCLALCIVGAFAGRHHGRRGHHFRPRPCRFEGDAEDLPEIPDGSCGVGSACDLGPRSWRLRRGARVDAYFCTRPKTLRDYGCQLKNETQDVIRERDCQDSAQCSLGPLNVTHDDEVKYAHFCDNAVSVSCLVESAAGEVLLNKTCFRHSECTLGPLAVTFEGQSAQAYFCGKPERDDEDSSGSSDDSSGSSDDDSSKSHRRGARHRTQTGRGALRRG